MNQQPTTCPRCVADAPDNARPLHPWNDADAILVDTAREGRMLVHSGCMRNADTVA